MTNKTIFKALILTLFFIISFGIYRVYEIFYSSYFNQIEYIQIATIGNKEMPTKIELLFSGFGNFQIIALSIIASFLLIYGKKLILK